MKVTRQWLWTPWDLAVAVCVAAAIVANGIAGWTTPRTSALAITCGLVAAAGLLGRTRHPLAVLLVVMVCSLLPTLATGSFPDFYASFVPTLASFYAVGSRCSTRQALLVPLVAVAVVVSFVVRVPAFATPSQLVYVGTGLVLAFAAGRAMRLLRRRADLEGARADLMARERDLRTREAVVAERERIARELHDVIAHDVAVMVVQAAAAERLLPTCSTDVSESLTYIQSSGRKAIDELHLLLGMLREDDQPLVAAAGLHAVAPLVSELARIGLPVSLDVTGSVRDVGDALDVSAFRIVQEALTNVLKHSAGSRTHVVVDYGLCDLTIRVVDDGHAGGPSPGLESSGEGLPGMRERVRMFGGTLHAGSQPAGGWAVTATFPLPLPVA
ncbi:sensor histidine kinase [Allobranchiibius sp. CTAmp26]|uniref:sensor histidine kinase n=1 Tax=Allobranchiibius sp. CTAmp26 TaxID=2815214 RepID=UPI001AA0CC88|nr:histidine kinase [Allobranchiibius sp. CTAmp26]MBO1754390.1 hypothetical protein [Allobranchiibius sp. CTAmp26]